jgi:aminoglycoside/choline kinase family phosphotransferase
MPINDLLSDATGARERIECFLERSGLAPAQTRVVPLTGDASDRRYYRVIHGDGSSAVLALHAEPFAYDGLPFVNVAALLDQIPLPIPRILGHAGDLGILMLQDLGDVTLQAHLGAASASEHADLYRQAVAFIDLMQRRGRDLASDAYLPYRTAFDSEKLTWELDFFVKHYVRAYRGASLTQPAQEALGAELHAVARELAAEPRVLCHRDYHSRNLMVLAGRLYVIDFQDARLGPDTYDLVSLLRDSYVDLTEIQVDELIDYFLTTRGIAPLSAPARAEFRRRFDVMALQRNLKALGTFGFQTTSRGNPVYIQYIPRTLRHLRTNLVRHTRFARLQELLSAHIEELR